MTSQRRAEQPKIGSHLREQTIMEITEEERLHERYRDLRTRGERWQRRAELATRLGMDELARQALGRRQHCLILAEAFYAEYERQRQRVAMLKRRLQVIEANAGSVGRETPRLETSIEVLRFVVDPVAEKLDALERDDLLDRQLRALKARLRVEGH